MSGKRIVIFIAVIVMIMGAVALVGQPQGVGAAPPCGTPKGGPCPTETPGTNPTATAISPTATPQPTATTNPGGWQLVWM